LIDKCLPIVDGKTWLVFTPINTLHIFIIILWVTYCHFTLKQVQYLSLRERWKA